MGACWSYCAGLFRGESGRLHRGGGSKYFGSRLGEHCTIEFENLVESEEEQENPLPCPRPINEDELQYLRSHHYVALSQTQQQIDLRLQEELEAQEERLRLEEEAKHEAQREEARAARAHMVSEKNRGRADGASETRDQRQTQRTEDFEVYLQTVKAQSEAFRSNRLPSDATVNPNTEMSWNLTSKTRSTERPETGSTEDGISLDLEWEDEEGMERLPQWERSRTEEDILRAALRPGPQSTPDDTALEWDSAFPSPVDLDQRPGLDQRLDQGPNQGLEPELDSEFEGFVNPVLDSDLEDSSR